MLEESVRHLLEAETHVLEADFLRDDHERHGRDLRVGVAHDSREDSRVAHAGIEDAQRRRRRPHVPELDRRALRHRGLLVAGIDEGEILLAIVVEPERGRSAAARR